MYLTDDVLAVDKRFEAADDSAILERKHVLRFYWFVQFVVILLQNNHLSRQIHQLRAHVNTLQRHRCVRLQAGDDVIERILRRKYIVTV